MPRSFSTAAVRHLVSEWVLPPGVKRLLRGTKRTESFELPAKDLAVLSRNAWLNDAFVGRRCFVLGNGPSLSAVNLDSLGEEVTVVMNAFNQHPAIRLWQPTIHCVGEPALRYENPEGLDFLKRILSGYTTTHHVFPIETQATFDRLGLLPPDRLVFVKQDGRKAPEFADIDLTKPVPAVHDTSILAVSVAIAMGCDPIFLLGLDYSWLSHGPTRQHFYSDSTVPWPAENLSEVPYLQEIREAVPRWEAHAALRQIGANRGQRIFNATTGSYLDVYPRIDLSHAEIDSWIEQLPQG